MPSVISPMLAHASFFFLLSSLCSSSADRQHVVTGVVIHPNTLTMEEYKTMVKAGVGRLILGMNIALPNGTFIIDSRLNKIFMDEIHGLVKNTDTEVHLAISPMLEQANVTQFGQGFREQIQHYFTEFNLDGVLIESYLNKESLQSLQDIGDILRSTYSWRSSRGQVGLMFDTSESNWDLLSRLVPGAYYDYAVCVLNMDGPVETANTESFAKGVLDKWSNVTRSPNMLEFGIVPEGRQSAENAVSYRDLIQQGAPATGTGKFNGFYYDSQTQVDEKARIVKAVNMFGISFFGVEADLPASDSRSLVAAALAAFHA
ncbi:hypothetical protein FOL47_011043 [Perkinsus chesapeaki]|uniref:Chitinase n=1 Tax=Perkinsus chesapeaki TaxID=330153 RepID=A0A7J6L136_PERCH|nr:hypothetical protein FOL47_011043 [Perkinsus chesapeaki]